MFRSMKRQPYQFILWRILYEKLHSSFPEGLLISKTFDWRGGFSNGSVEILHRRKEKIQFCKRRKSSLAKKRSFSGHFVRWYTREVEVGMMMGGSIRGRNCSHSTSGKLAPTFLLLSHLKCICIIFKCICHNLENVFFWLILKIYF